MEHLGRILILVGGAIFLTGILFSLGFRLPFIGKLPGDIHIQKGNFQFYFPLTTSLFLSILLTALFWLYKLFK